MDPLLAIERLQIVTTDAGRVLVDLAGLTIGAGEIVGLVGQSGAGKSLTALGIMGLAAEHGLHVDGRVLFDGTDLLSAPADKLDQVRGRRIALMFQDPAAAVDPARTCLAQFREALRHGHLTDAEVQARTRAALGRVGLGDVPGILDRFPKRDLSGGERQRFLLALTMVQRPALLIVDEPTTGLDPLNRMAFVQQLKSLRAAEGTAVLLISHDADLVNALADRVYALSAGRLTAADPAPSMPKPAARALGTGTPLLRLKQVRRRLGQGRAARTILNDIDLDVRFGEALGVIGRSGAGKSSLAAIIAGLSRPDSGDVEWSAAVVKPGQCRLQMVFQDYGASLDPLMHIEDSLAEVVPKPSLADWPAIQQQWLRMMDLPSDVGGRRPHQISGGQLQRVALMRALISRPQLVVLDEPTTALDHESRTRFAVSLANARQAQPNLALLLVSHDLDLVAAICERVIVLEEGRIVESGPAASVLHAPESRAASALVDAWLNLRASASPLVTNSLDA
ncbi:MAG: ATP-binding cassette domain-containing protein [Beijerinckiaceae bacterium]|nr:ATP-binding cassette domain-containing protein [Beijerinckiaceae bacterium]